MTIELLLLNINKIIRKYLSPDYKIYLFGSWVNKEARSNSDLDIAIMGNKKIDWSIMAKLLNDVDDIPTLRGIDIVDLNSTSEEFRRNVLAYAKPLEL